MSATLRAYLLRQFLKLIFVAAGTLAMLFLVFDLLAQSDKILTGGMAPWQAIPLYAALRLPQIIALILPIAAMIAIMGTYGKIHGHHEVSAMTSAGIRLTRIVWVFLLGAAFVAALHFIFINSVVLKTSEQLRLWKDNDFKPIAENVAISRYPAWFEVSNRIIFAQSAEDNGHTLIDIRLIERNEIGLMEQFISAQKITYVAGTKWAVSDAEIRDLATGETIQKDTQIIDLKTMPADLALFNKQTEELTLKEMWVLVKAAHLTNSRGYFYETWLQRRISQPFSILIMMLVATPLLFMSPRQTSKTRLSFFVLLSGFLFFVGERIFLAMGENGELPPSLTIWFPPFIYMAILLMYILWKESAFSKR